ncbi:unnamed protein product [Choristocarpus tenellus]
MPTRPHMDFDDINQQVVPWPILSPNLGIEINADQPAEPRCFKSHQPLSSVWRGGRYICTLRDPVAVIESW